MYDTDAKDNVGDVTSNRRITSEVMTLRMHVFRLPGLFWDNSVHFQINLVNYVQSNRGDGKQKIELTFHN